MAAELQLDPCAPELCFRVDPVAHFRQHDDGTPAREQPRSRYAASRRAKNDHALTLDGEGMRRSHRSFRVVRLNNAKMIARMTNLEMTFGSLQPMSSKW